MTQYNTGTVSVSAGQVTGSGEMVGNPFINTWQVNKLNDLLTVNFKSCYGSNFYFSLPSLSESYNRPNEYQIHLNDCQSIFNVSTSELPVAEVHKLKISASMSSIGEIGSGYLDECNISSCKIRKIIML